MSGKMSGRMHWGQKRHVGTRHEAYHDVHVYEVPYTGKGDADRMYGALVNGRHDKRPKPWIGACGSVCVAAVDDTRKVATIEVRHPIGD